MQDKACTVWDVVIEFVAVSLSIVGLWGELDGMSTPGKTDDCLECFSLVNKCSHSPET